MSTEFRFQCGENFTVVNFTGSEAISRLYEFEIEIKAPENRGIDIHEILDDPVTFIAHEQGVDYPVHGILASLDEIKTVQGYVHYRAVLVPQLWKLSLYKTNEIYTHEKTVNNIIKTVLENAGLVSGTDFELGMLSGNNFLSREYVCQFGESDFDFICRLCENEGIFFYFDQSGAQEKVIFANDDHYPTIDKPDMFYEPHATADRHHVQIKAMACRVKRLPGNVTVRDYNPVQPSHDISNTQTIDSQGFGTDYNYGGYIISEAEAAHIAEIRAEEMLCNKTRFYGESGGCRFQSGHKFALDKHPNDRHNGLEYLLLEVSHHGSNLDLTQLGEGSKHQSTYHNSFVAMEASNQFRPPRITPKPRFYGTMTAFIYAETGTNRPEVNERGEYRVHLPFDRADGAKHSSDPDRKASAWIRMAQPYVGEDQGFYFPLTGGTEVLLTFINGDPDQPVISAALPNASQPSLMENNPEWTSMVTNKITLDVSGNKHSISTNSARMAALNIPPPSPIPAVNNAHFINDGTVDLTYNMLPPWIGVELSQSEIDDATPAYNESLIKFKKYDKDFVATDMSATDLNLVSTERGAGDNYVYSNARTFAYPQHERVYFIGTFHEDFHVKDDFMSTNSHTGIVEQWNFPAPGENYPENTAGDTHGDDQVNPSGIRGVSEDKRWGDQMFYAFGRSYNWSAGAGEGGSFEVINYGNGTTENLINYGGGRFFDKIRDHYEDCHETMHLFNNRTFGARGRPPGSVPNPYSERNYKDLLEQDKNHKDHTDADPKEGAATYDFTLGNTYSYHNGFSLDVKQGDSDSWTYGDSREYVHGHSCSIVEGDSRSDVLGSTTDMLAGNSNSLTIGLTTDMFLGAKEETSVSGSLKFELAGEVGLSATYDKYLKNFTEDTTAKENKTSIQSIQASLKNIATYQDALFTCMNFEVITGAKITLSGAGGVAINTMGMASVNGSVIKVG